MKGWIEVTNVVDDCTVYVPIRDIDLVVVDNKGRVRVHTNNYSINVTESFEIVEAKMMENQWQA